MAQKVVMHALIYQ